MAKRQKDRNVHSHREAIYDKLHTHSEHDRARGGDIICGRRTVAAARRGEKVRKLNRKTCLMIGLLALVIAEPSFAGTGGDEFSDVWTTIKDWTQGTLGRVVAGSMILVGIISGVARQSLMAFAIGIGGGIGGSQREERLDILENRIKELGMNPEDYWWYCDLRRYGSCRHAGFGQGFERMVMYLTGVGNIRDVELHPRTVGNAEF